MSGRRIFSIFQRWTSALGAYTKTNKVGGAPGRVRTAAASSPSVSSLGEGGNETGEPGGANPNYPCSPLECLSWLMFETMVALVPEP